MCAIYPDAVHNKPNQYPKKWQAHWAIAKVTADFANEVFPSGNAKPTSLWHFDAKETPLRGSFQIKILRSLRVEATVPCK